MKKYLPSVEELVSGIVIIVAGMVVWSLVSMPILNGIASLKAKVTPAA